MWIKVHRAVGTAVCILTPHTSPIPPTLTSWWETHSVLFTYYHIPSESLWDSLGLAPLGVLVHRVPVRVPQTWRGRFYPPGVNLVSRPPPLSQARVPTEREVFSLVTPSTDTFCGMGDGAGRWPADCSPRASLIWPPESCPLPGPSAGAPGAEDVPRAPTTWPAGSDGRSLCPEASHAVAMSAGLGLILCPADCPLLVARALECPSFPFWPNRRTAHCSQSLLEGRDGLTSPGPGLGLFLGPVEAAMDCTEIKSSATAVTDLQCTLNGVQDERRDEALCALGKQAP